MLIQSLLDDYKAKLGLLFILTMCLRVIAIFIYAWNDGLQFEYAQIAANIVAGYGYSWDWFGQQPLQPSAAFPPVYAYFIAFFIALFDNPAPIILIAQAMINSLGIIPAYLIGKHLGNKSVGLICAIIYAFLPEMIYSNTKMVTEPIAGTLTLVAIYSYLKIKDTVRPYWSYLILGVYIGLLSLLNASLLLLLPAFIIGLYYKASAKKNLLKAALLLSIGAIIAISPWIIRNYAVLGKPVFRTTLGYNLWRGNYPGASGTGRVDPNNKDVIVLNKEYYNYIKTNHPQKEIEIDSFFTAEAVKFIKARPLRFAGITLKRAVYFITIDPTHPLTKNVFYLGGYLFLLIFGIWGGIILNRRNKLDLAFILMPLFHLLLYSPVMILPRYRMILIWVLIILSSVSIEALLSKLKSR